MVLHEDDDELDALGHGGDELGVEHQVRAVADHDDDLALVAVGKEPALGPQAAGDLVSHARERVFDVVAERVAHTPQLVQIAREGSGGLHDDVGRVEGRLHGPDDLGLPGHREAGRCKRGIHRGIPLGLLPNDAVGVVGIDLVASSSMDSSARASRASAITGSCEPCLYASNEATLMLTNTTSGGFWNAVREPVVKSL